MKIICIGRNYNEHISELNNQRPENPVVFLKPDTSILLKTFPFVVPEFTQDCQHEVEVVVKINKVGKYIAPKYAHKCYNEIGLGIDFTARDVQQKLKQAGLPWEISKSFDGSTVVGNFLPKDNFTNIQNIQFSLEKNGEIVQQGNTKDMLFSIDEIISYVSQFFTLKIGDLIYTGTPAGVSKVSSGDQLKGYLEDNQLFDIKVL